MSIYFDKAAKVFIWNENIKFDSPNRDEQLDKMELYVYASELQAQLVMGGSIEESQRRAKKEGKEDREYMLCLMECAHNGGLFP